jgi:preprotein translocase subunit SecE
VNRETKRMMQRQGQMEADGSPPSRKPPPSSGAGGRQPGRQPRPQAKKRTGIVQFFREVRDELRQVAWPTRAELMNYTAVVLTTLILMIILIFLLNYAFGKAVFYMFQK